MKRLACSFIAAALLVGCGTVETEKNNIGEPIPQEEAVVPEAEVTEVVEGSNQILNAIREAGYQAEFNSDLHSGITMRVESAVPYLSAIVVVIDDLSDPVAQMAWRTYAEPTEYDELTINTDTHKSVNNGTSIVHYMYPKTNIAIRSYEYPDMPDISSSVDEMQKLYDVLTKCEVDTTIDKDYISETWKGAPIYPYDVIDVFTQLDLKLYSCDISRNGAYLSFNKDPGVTVSISMSPDSHKADSFNNSKIMWMASKESDAINHEIEESENEYHYTSYSSIFTDAYRGNSTMFAVTKEDDEEFRKHLVDVYLSLGEDYVDVEPTINPADYATVSGNEAEPETEEVENTDDISE